jgi:threonine dehydrogenase-like Zn-dependent dehydrogenase
VGRVAECPDPSLAGRRVVGEINAGCGVCELCRAGDSRHCRDRTVLGIKGRDGAFAEFLSLPVRNLIEVPDSIADEEAVFVEPLAAACNIIEQVAITSSSRVAVIGDGKLAQLIARVISLTGCDLTVAGKHTQKLDHIAITGARACLIDSVNQSSLQETAERIRSVAGRELDVVIEATGSRTGLPLALELVRPRGTVVLKSTHQGPATVEMWPVVVNEIRLIGSRCGRFAEAVELLSSRTVTVSDLISDVFPLREGLAAFDRASAPGSMKVVLTVSE